LPKITTPQDQRAILDCGLGKFELKVINSFNLPLFWMVPNEDGTERYRDGTAFFLNAGARLFASPQAMSSKGGSDPAPSTAQVL